MSGFVWYSYGSDKTGPILGQALGFEAGKKTPDFHRYDVVIGWGCKPGTKYDSEALAQLIAQNQVRLLNHPETVALNRDKLGTLKILRDLGLSVPGFLEFDPKRPAVAGGTLIPHALEQGEISLPLVILTRHNKGEPVFCYTLEDVKAALKGNSKKKDPYCYARTFDQGDEYRIGVFRDGALYAQKKDQGEDPVEATMKTLIARAKRHIKKSGMAGFNIHHDTALLVAEIAAKELVSSASQLKKSVKMGWRWLDWGMDLVPAEVASLAIEAVDTAKLDMGAVSISHTDGVARVLSITTAPGLSEEQMGLYVAEILNFVNHDGKTKDLATKKAAKKRSLASPELVARLYQRVKGLSADKAEEVLQSLEE